MLVSKPKGSLLIRGMHRAIMQASHDRIAEKTAARVVHEQKLLHQLSEERITQKVSLDVSTQLANMAKHLQMLEDKRTHEEKQTEYIIVRSESTWRGAKLPKYEPTSTGQLVAASSRERSEWNLSVQLPAWMSRAVWEIQVCWSITGGWQQSLRSFSVRSKHSAIFAVVQKGDVGGMMGMFSTGKASPLDRDEKGSSLLYVSFPLLIPRVANKADAYSMPHIPSRLKYVERYLTSDSKIL